MSYTCTVEYYRHFKVLIWSGGPENWLNIDNLTLVDFPTSAASCTLWVWANLFVYVPALLSVVSPHCELSIIINYVPGSIYVNKVNTVVGC